MHRKAKRKSQNLSSCKNGVRSAKGNDSSYLYNVHVYVCK